MIKKKKNQKSKPFTFSRKKVKGKKLKRKNLPTLKVQRKGKISKPFKKARLRRSVAKTTKHRRQGFGLRPTKSPSADKVGGRAKVGLKKEIGSQKIFKRKNLAKTSTAFRKKGSDKKNTQKVALGKKRKKNKSRTFLAQKVQGKRKKTTKVKKTFGPKRKTKIAVRMKKEIKTKKRTAEELKISKTFTDPTIHKTKIRVIGIGGGGSTVVSEITSRIKKADFYVANTDAQALRESAKATKRFQFGQNFTQGLGTGMNVELGEAAAQEEKERIKDLLEGQDFCIIIACLGGGTSSGATPVFAKISKGLGNITYGIFTLPFEFEGEKKMEAALDALEKIRPNLNVYTVIPNERIFQTVDKNTPLKEALSVINKRLADNLGGLIEMIYLSGLINIDFADLKTILAGRGRLTYLNTAEIEKIEKEEIVKKLISSPLHPYTVKGARGVLYNITGGKNIQLSEVSQISNIISESVNKKAKIIFGITQNQKYKNRIRVTLLATGCSAKGFLAKSSKSQRAKLKIKRLKVRKTIKKVNQPAKTLLRKTSTARPELERKPIPPFQKSKRKPKPQPESQPKKTAPPAKKSIKTEDKSKKKKNKTLSVRKKEKRSEKKIGASTLKSSSNTLEKNKKEIQSKQTSQEVSIPIATSVSRDNISGRQSGISGSVRPGSLTELSRGSFSEGGKVRKNALQVKKEAEEAEKEILEKEKVWEIPAILRRKRENR